MEHESQKREQIYSTEAEQSVLGAMILNKDCVNIAMKTLSLHDFYHEQHKDIFNAIHNLKVNDNPIDMITLSEELKDHEKLSYTGGISYLTNLTSIVQHTTNIMAYIEIIKKKHILRQIIDATNRITNKAYRSDINIGNDIESLDSLLRNSKSIDNLVLKMSDIKNSDKDKKFLQTGFNKIDEWLGGGLKSGSLTVFTGYPGAGKSTILNQITADIISQGYKSFLYSGELDPSGLVTWLTRTISNDYHLVDKETKLGHKYKDVSTYGFELIRKWFEDKLFIFDNDTEPSEKNLIAVIEHLHIEKDVKFFVLDNLMMIRAKEGRQQLEEQENLIRNLKELASKYNISILLVAHPRKTMNEIITLDDIAGSSSIRNLADTVFSIERGKKEGEASKLWLIKNRWGSINDTAIAIRFDIDRKRFYTDGSELIKDYGYDLNKKFVQAEISSPF
jgi:replicative DNA helicase